MLTPIYSPCFPYTLKWKILLKTFIVLWICIALHKLKAQPCKYLVTQLAYSCKAFQWRQIDPLILPWFQWKRADITGGGVHYLANSQSRSSPDLHPQPLHSVPLHLKFNPSLWHDFALESYQITSVHSTSRKAWLGFIRHVCIILLSKVSESCHCVLHHSEL